MVVGEWDRCGGRRYDGRTDGRTNGRIHKCVNLSAHLSNLSDACDARAQTHSHNRHQRRDTSKNVVGNDAVSINHILCHTNVRPLAKPVLDCEVRTSARAPNDLMRTRSGFLWHCTCSPDCTQHEPGQVSKNDRKSGMYCVRFSVVPLLSRTHF